VRRVRRKHLCEEFGARKDYGTLENTHSAWQTLPKTRTSSRRRTWGRRRRSRRPPPPPPPRKPPSGARPAPPRYEGGKAGGKPPRPLKTVKLTNARRIESSTRR